MQELLNRIVDSIDRGVTRGNLVAAFIVLSVVQGFLGILAWVTSSGYEDSFVPYALQLFVGLCVMVVLAIIMLKIRSEIRKERASAHARNGDTDDRKTDVRW